MTARRPAENTELMLYANHVHIRDVQKIRRAQIRGQVLLSDFKPYFRRIIIALRQIIHRHDEALQRGKFLRHGTAQVCRERGNTAFARQIIAEKRDLADVRWGLHELLRWHTQPTCADNSHGAARGNINQEPFPGADGKKLNFLSAIFRRVANTVEPLLFQFNQDAALLPILDGECDRLRKSSDSFCHLNEGLAQMLQNVQSDFLAVVEVRFSFR